MNNYNSRIIAKLEVKKERLIKGISFEGLRHIGVPSAYANKYYTEGIDEILYHDVTASLYGYNSLTKLVKNCSKSVFIPITISGGISSSNDAIEMIASGGDKIAINTAFVSNNNLCEEIVNKVGSQAVTVSIDAKQIEKNKWNLFTEAGREPTGIDVIEWAKLMAEKGVGEILLTSIDQDGTKNGFDINLYQSVYEAVDVPIIISGGMGKLDHLTPLKDCPPSGIAIASIFHYDTFTIKEVKDFCSKLNLNIR